MENREKLKIKINGKEYDSLEEVPEEYRALIQKKVEEARSGAPAEAGSVKVKNFHFSTNFSTESEVAVTSRNLEDGVNGTRGGHAPRLQPVSSSWVIWLLAAAGLLIYFFSR